MVKHVLLLGIDGLPSKIPAPHSFERDLPTLHALTLRNAVWTEAQRCVFPTDSFPNWTSLFTSTEPHIHGIDSNFHKRTNPIVLNTEGECYTMPHLFQSVREQSPDAVLGAFYTWYGFEEILKPKDCFDARIYCKTDKKTTEKTIDHVRTKLKDAKSSLTFVHLDDIDEDCHSAGYHSRGVWKAALNRTDAECGKILDAYREIGLLESKDFMVVVCSDHGRDFSGKYHGYFSLECLETRLVIHSPSFEKFGAPRKLKTRPITITDIAPTILFAIGLDIPLQFRGRPLLEAWDLETKKLMDRVEDREARKDWKGVKIHRWWIENEHNMIGAAFVAVSVLAVEAMGFMAYRAVFAK